MQLHRQWRFLCTLNKVLMGFNDSGYLWRNGDRGGGVGGGRGEKGAGGGGEEKGEGVLL